MIRLENSDRSKAETGVNSIPLVDLSKEQNAKLLERTTTIGGPVNAEARVQFSNIYNECCTGVDKSRGPQNRNERAEQQGAATDPKWGSARDRLTKNDSQKNEIREKGYRQIQYGDTLSDIAKANLELKNGGKAASGAEIWREVERLAKLNNLDPRKNIRPGTNIYMEKCDDRDKAPKPGDKDDKAKLSVPATGDAGKGDAGKGDVSKSDVGKGDIGKADPGKGDVSKSTDEKAEKQASTKGNGQSKDGKKPGIKDALNPDNADTPKSPDQTPSISESDDPILQKPADSDEEQDNPPVNYTPYKAAPPDEGLRSREHDSNQEQQHQEQEFKKREEGLKSKDEDLRRREEDLKRQLEDLQRQKEELRRREEDLKRCATGKDDSGIWEH